MTKYIDKQVVKDFLTDTFNNDKNNAIIDYYLSFRNDNISIANKMKQGKVEGMCYVIEFDDISVIDQNDLELFYFALSDDEWLEDVGNECEEEIKTWLENES